jgi:hypothetical protein
MSRRSAGGVIARSPGDAAISIVGIGVGEMGVSSPDSRDVWGYIAVNS